MRRSRYYIPTLKEAPADAEVVSHRLLVRAGMIRRLTAGIYTYLPLGLRALSKVEAVVREEMNRAGALELLLPAVQPADLWRESGRWTQYGRELLRFKDRHERDCCLGPTHEEVITDLLRGELRSYRQLPLILYQIQTKFRDEIRPRFGLMRGREFIMKDAYSFDKDDAGASASYAVMFDAYARIFRRLGLRFRAVEADSGAIGGNFSHEFMIPAGAGEDVIAACASCDYAANSERAETARPPRREEREPPAMRETATPGIKTVADLAEFLHIPPSGIVKTLILEADGKPLAVLVRGDHEVNELKVKKHLGADEVRQAAPEQVEAHCGAPAGFVGPVGLAMPVLADHALWEREGWVCGARARDIHLLDVSLARDAGISDFADLRAAGPGDACPRCGGRLEFIRGIEAGHVFKLGLKYSKAMNAVFLDENGVEQHLVMGCYGIGISRVVAACIEQNHDARGICFPPPMAPFAVHLVNLDRQASEVTAQAEKIYADLCSGGYEVLFDDRNERAGVKLNDADILGSPVQIIVGAKSLGRGAVEAEDRRSGRREDLRLAGFAEEFGIFWESVCSGWGLACGGM
ncbi:MAG: proline--tRNA ligase [Desulfovibrio sp.]|jgi:prolyl-tRNA synthetase|nr:proline--tRNA ligase [Desulfovibrio sp.]